MEDDIKMMIDSAQMRMIIQHSDIYKYFRLQNINQHQNPIINNQKIPMDIRQKKQQYLRDNILDANYDPEQFMDFIGNSDIDQWTFDQLVEIVQNFIASKKNEIKTTSSGMFENQFDNWGAYIQQIPVKKEQPKFQLNLFDLDFLESTTGNKPVSTNIASLKTGTTTSVQNKPPVNSNYMTVPADVVKKLQQGNDSFIVGYNPAVIPPPVGTKKIETSININRNQSPPYREQKKQYSSINNQQATTKTKVISINETSSQNFEKVLTCKKLINKSRLQGNEDIVISGHQIVNPNVFVPKYVLYFITVNPLNVEVKRRLKDFQSLRVLLKKFFPTTQIPHLERCSRLSETEPATIKKQVLFLQSFLNSLLTKKQLRCKLLEQFLLCPDLDLLKKIFKQYEKLSGPRSLESLFSPSGQIELKMCQENRKYVNQHIGLNEFMKQHFIKIKNLYDTLMEGFEANTKTIGEIEQLHKVFKERIKNTNSQFTPEYQCPQLQKSIERVELMHKQWASSFKTQVRIIQSEIRHLYRYEQDNIDTLGELIKFEQDITSSYAKRSDKDQANRQPYQSKKLQQFKTTLQNPSKNITVLKHQAAYMQQKSSQQCLGYLQQLSKKVDNKYKLFCTLQFSICQDMETVWKQFQNYYK